MPTARASRITWRKPYAHSDWVLFAIYVAAAALAFAGLAWAMRLDEAAAARGRAEYEARTLATGLAQMAASPGTDLAALLPPLAAAAGADVQLAIVEQPDEPAFAFLARRRYVAHSVPGLAGEELAARGGPDRRDLLLLRDARQLGGTPALEWRDGRLVAAAVARGNPQLAGLVRGLEPRAPGRRPWTLALTGFAMLVLFAAGLHDIFPRAGKYLNVLAFLLALGAVYFLGTALSAELWRADEASALVASAETLRLKDLAGELARDLPPRGSSLPGTGIPIAAAAFLVYVAGLAGVWRRAARRIRREAVAWRFATPVLAVLVGVAVLPLAVGLWLAFQRATPVDRTFIGFGNFAAILSREGFASPSAAWLPLVTTAAFALANVLVQLPVALALALVLRRLTRTLASYRAVLVLPWAVPAFAVAMLWRALLEGGAGPVPPPAGGWFGSSGAAFVANVFASAWSGFPLVLAVALEAVRRVPAELDEAARLDGAPRWRRFAGLTWPLVRGALRPALAIAAVTAANAIALVRLLSGGAPEGTTDLVSTRAYAWAFERYEFGLGAAWAVLGLVLAAVIALGIAWRPRAGAAR